MFVNPAQLIRSYQFAGVLVELAVIWLGVYLVFRFLRGTRWSGIIRGFAILLVLLTLLVRGLGHNSDAFGRLNHIYNYFLGILAISLIVIFQPELRQAMIRLSQTRHFRPAGQTGQVIEAVSEAVEFLSKNQFGALIAIERGTQLGGLVEAGQALDAIVSSRLLESIFWPNSPLHDLGVVIRHDRVVAAGVQFPLAEEGVLPARTGSRHRAAAGLTLESDCIVVIVSEETGQVSVAEGGRIDFDIPREQLQDDLARRMAAPLPLPLPVQPDHPDHPDHMDGLQHSDHDDRAVAGRTDQSTDEKHAA